MTIRMLKLNLRSILSIFSCKVLRNFLFSRLSEIN